MLRTVDIDDLTLDRKNPRFPDEVDSEGEAVTALIMDGPAKLYNLAEDIAKKGSLNPTELPVVCQEDDELVVVEGNRRIAALKLLSDPKLADSATAKSPGLNLVNRLTALGKDVKLPTAVDVYEAPDRESARHWIELRHTGENDGVGVASWKSWQANNYRRRRGSQADKASIYCAAIQQDYANDPSILADVVQVRKTRLTTLGRLLSDPDFRREVGVIFQDEDLVFEFPADAIQPFVRKLFQDLADPSGLTVTAIKTKQMRRKYVADNESYLPDRATRLPIPRRPGAAASNPPSQQSAPGAPSANSATTGTGQQQQQASPAAPPSGPTGSVPPPRTPPAERVIFQGARLPKSNARIGSLLRESQKISIDDAPQACGILLRIILELAITDAINRKKIKGNESDTLRKKFRNALLAIDPDCADPKRRRKDLEVAWTQSQDPNGVAIQSMHAFVHNSHASPNFQDVRNLSHNFRPLLDGITGIL